MKNPILNVSNVQSDNLFEMKLDNVKHLSHILKVLNFKEMATCFVSENGLKIVVEDAKCVQVSAFIGEDVFQEFHVTEEVTFKVDLNVLLDCLSMFDNCSTVPGATAALKMFCTHQGAPLKLLLEEEGVITDCSLKTLEPDEILDFDFPASNVVNKVILQSAQFKDVFNELDPTSECVELLLSPDAPYFQLTTKGLAGDCQVHILHTSEMIEAFQCTKEIRSRFSQIRPAMKPLAISVKVSVRTDDVGLLCLQFMIQTEAKQLCYIEYYCTPVVDDV
ncbi:cell cycle checkpoint protein RAD1-like isoform X2 [Macrosteles quadrilineatus]|uniref:cell cycle checkpoint protein RAD1-like isoform X2 n=1 Tax=Macrosteles quadrilineatus TaxID=74068 RepID=UPI0023E15BED|nr:cell cycle checkpoint protein RAD1-like isoform X2 [Macrosteles quadrilineatus]